MNSSPLVSIVLPTFNRSKVLNRSIDSVLYQTYTKWELIIWDDGSTDDTKEIVKSVKDSRIQYFHDRNHGVAFARNRAIEKATGEYLAFLDSDDEWLPDKLSTQVKILNLFNDIDLLFSDYENVRGTSEIIHSKFNESNKLLKRLKSRKIQEDTYIVEEGILECIATENIIATDTILVKKDIIQKTGPFREELRNSEDFELWWRMGLSNVSFAFVNRVFLKRYKSTDTLSSSTIEACKNALTALDICKNRSIMKSRKSLIPYLNIAYRNIWQNLILLYSYKKDCKNLIVSFIQSNRYGIRLGTFRLFINGMVNCCS